MPDPISRNTIIKVDGQVNAVNFGDQNKSSASRMAGTTVMQPGAVYTFNIPQSDYISVGGGGLMITRGTDKQEQSERTRAQIVIEKPDGSIERRDYSPGVQISSDEFDPGSKVGVVFVDGDNADQLKDNYGYLNVTMTETVAQAEGAAGGTVVDKFEDGPIVTTDVGSVGSAQVPPPGAPSPLEVDSNVVTTRGGYKFDFREDGFHLYAPGQDKEASYFTTKGLYANDVFVGDGGNEHSALDENGRARVYTLQDGTTFQPLYSNSTGLMGTSADIVGVVISQGDSVQEVKYDGGKPVFSEEMSGGNDWRRDVLNNRKNSTLYLGGNFSGNTGTKSYNDQYTWNQFRGNEFEGVVIGSNMRALAGTDRGKNQLATDSTFVVDPRLRPPPGSEGYRHALDASLRAHGKNAIADVAGADPDSTVTDAQKTAFYDAYSRNPGDARRALQLSQQNTAILTAREQNADLSREYPYVPPAVPYVPPAVPYDPANPYGQYQSGQPYDPNGANYPYNPQVGDPYAYYSSQWANQGGAQGPPADGNPLLQLQYEQQQKMQQMQAAMMQQMQPLMQMFGGTPYSGAGNFMFAMMAVQMLFMLTQVQASQMQNQFNAGRFNVGLR